MIPFRLEHAIKRSLKAQPRDAQKLFQLLAGAKLSPAEARDEWPFVLEHKWLVSERLGRDTGLRVAAVDYVENIRAARPPRAESDAPARNLSRVAKELAAAYLTHQSRKAHDGLFISSAALDGVSVESLARRGVGERLALRRLAGVRLSAAEAAAAWPRVLNHKWLVSERLGRDTGLRVAALDYFENVRPPRRARTPMSRASRLSRSTQAHGVMA